VFVVLRPSVLAEQKNGILWMPLPLLYLGIHLLFQYKFHPSDFLYKLCLSFLASACGVEAMVHSFRDSPSLDSPFPHAISFHPTLSHFRVYSQGVFEQDPGMMMVSLLPWLSVFLSYRIPTLRVITN